MWLQFEAEWSQERKDQYLLRRDIEKPLSTDNTTWPSLIFDLQTWDVASRDSLFDVWFRDGLQGLSVYLNSVLDIAKMNYWVIGITVLHESYDKEDTHYPSVPVNSLPLSSPPYDSQEWTFLGYDVSDEGFTSGLSNCGYAPDEVPALRERWGPHLNQYHLFSDVDQAIEFKKLSDDRVREHAPFFVYGLYLVEDNTQ